MKIDQDKLPSNLEEAVQMLMDALEPMEREHLKKALKTDSTLCYTHFLLGMSIRNNWNLWEDSPIARWFIKTWKICHADDMSAIILAAFAARFQGKAFDPAPMVAEFHTHWKKSYDSEHAPEAMIREWMRNHNVTEL